MDPVNFLQETEYSALKDDNDDRRRDSDDEDNDSTYDPINTVHYAPPLEAPPLKHRNTGVKGVLADAAESRELRRMEIEIDNLKNEWRMKQMALASSISAHHNDNEELEEEKKTQEDDFEKDELEDDEFWLEYRRKRMEEIKKAQNPTFGYLQKIDRSQFVDSVEKESPRVFVCIHLFQDYIPACVRLNLCLQKLAIKYPYVKFLKILSTEALESFDDIGLATLSVYKAGELYTSIIRVQDYLPADFDAKDVETLLKSHNILQK